MSQDEELDNLIDILEGPYGWRSDLAELIMYKERKARINELKDLQIKGEGNKFTPFEYHYYINNRVIELTNQQEREQ